MEHTKLEYAAVAALAAFVAAGEEQEPETHKMVPTQVDPFPQEEETPFPRYEPLP